MCKGLFINCINEQRIRSPYMSSLLSLDVTIAFPTSPVLMIACVSLWGAYDQSARPVQVGKGTSNTQLANS